MSPEGRPRYNVIELVVTLALVSLQAAILLPVFSHS